MDCFVDPHSRYSEVREKDSDGLAEAANQTNESLYFKKVEDDYNSCTKIYDEYLNTLKSKEDNAKID